MKKILIAMLGAAFVLGACGAADEPAPVEEEAPAEEAPADEVDEAAEEAPVTAGDYDAEAAQASYQSCQGCHGADLQGASAPALTGLDYDHILRVTLEGAPGMPAGLVTGEDAENLAAWIAAQ